MNTVIVGGGISGLTCAYRLRQLGFQVTLLEQSNRPGGVITTIRQDGFQFELGPQSFLSNQTLLDLVSGLKLDAELLRADPRAPRYILLGGQLHAAPMSPPGLFMTPLLSTGTKFRLLAEPFRKTQPPESDESIGAFVRRKFGDDLLENLVGPFVSGVHAGDPERLSLRSAFPSIHQWEKDFGSVLRGAMKSRPPKDTPKPTLCSFRDGVGTLTSALSDSLGEAIRTNTRVESLVRGKVNGQSRYTLRVHQSGRSEPLSADAVVLATPTLAAAEILSAQSSCAGALLRKIEYAPVLVLGAGYRREQVGQPINGFGFLVPRKEDLRVLGTVWCSSLFPGRAPEGMVNLTSFVGGATDTRLSEQTDDEIAAAALQEVAKVLRIAGPPETRVLQRWPRALPQYNLGHSETLAALRAEVSRFPGLFLTGNYLGGASVGLCAEQAMQTAQAVGEYLTSQKNS